MKRMLCLLVLAGILLSGCAREERNPQQVHLLPEESTFHDFSVQDNLVDIRCSISVANPTDEAVRVIIIGTFDEDQEAGLLKERCLVGVLQKQPDEVILTIPPGGSRWLDIHFYGTFAGLHMKQNRLLPELELIAVQSPPHSPATP